MENQNKVEVAIAPFVVEFTLAVIKSLVNKNFPRPKQGIIHSDMIPKFSSHVITASMKEKIIKPREEYKQSILNVEVPRIIKHKPRMMLQIQNLPEIRPAQKTAIIGGNPDMAWQKIEPLIKDPSVTHIECPGPGMQIMVSRAGQRQVTRISLADNEIKKILEVVAEKSHIPLLEGVFRAAVDDILINAVVSEIIGSKFVIKKNTPYSMLEV